MKNLAQLKHVYYELLEGILSEEEREVMELKFLEDLIGSDDYEYLDFHYEILKNKHKVPKLFYYHIRASFKERSREKVELFLFEKFISGKENPIVKGDIIQILGSLKSPYGKKLAVDHINNSEKELRNKSIIVLGWLGDYADLKVLEERLCNDPDPQLRSYAATAMRQIWYNHPRTKSNILLALKNALLKETEDTALVGIIITAQDLLKKKLGLKESRYGDVSGDIEKAKVKTLNALTSD